MEVAVGVADMEVAVGVADMEVAVGVGEPVTEAEGPVMGDRRDGPEAG